MATSGTASAQSTTQQKTLAEALFRDGRALFTAGDYEKACPKFAESQRADPTTGTLLHLALCHEQIGKTASAWSEFTEAAAQAARAHQGDRETLARTHAQALDSQLSRLVVRSATTVDGLQIKLDGEILGAGALDTALPVDPGAHQIEASAPGRKPWTSAIAAPKGPAKTEVLIPELEEAPPEPVAVVAPVVVAPPSPVVEAPTGTSTRTIVGLSLIGAGVISAGVGGVLGVQTFSHRSDATRECPSNRCTQGGLDSIDSAKSSALFSTITFGAGALLAGVGTYFLVTKSSPSEKPQTASTWVRATALPGHASVTLGGQF